MADNSELSGMVADASPLLSLDRDSSTAFAPKNTNDSNLHQGIVGSSGELADFLSGSTSQHPVDQTSIGADFQAEHDIVSDKPSDLDLLASYQEKSAANLEQLSSHQDQSASDIEQLSSHEEPSASNIAQLSSHQEPSAFGLEQLVSGVEQSVSALEQSNEGSGRLASDPFADTSERSGSLSDPLIDSAEPSGSLSDFLPDVLCQPTLDPSQQSICKDAEPVEGRSFSPSKLMADVAQSSLNQLMDGVQAGAEPSRVDDFEKPVEISGQLDFDPQVDAPKFSDKNRDYAPMADESLSTGVDALYEDFANSGTGSTDLMGGFGDSIHDKDIDADTRGALEKPVDVTSESPDLLREYKSKSDVNEEPSSLASLAQHHLDDYTVHPSEAPAVPDRNRVVDDAPADRAFFDDAEEESDVQQNTHTPHSGDSLNAFIPPFPDKPLPPTPGDEQEPAHPGFGDGTVLRQRSSTAEGSLVSDIREAFHHPVVMELLLWRDPKKSGVAFVAGLVVLVSMLYFSFISVLAYLALSVLAVTLGFRVYKSVMGAVAKADGAHPFQDLLSIDATLKSEKAHELTDKLVADLNCCFTTLKDLFLIKDMFESIKFGVVLYLVTYLGAWFNTMTLIILAYVCAFTLPKVYEQNKTQIDKVLAQASEKITEVLSKVKAVVPFGSKAAEPVEKKEE